MTTKSIDDVMKELEALRAAVDQVIADQALIVEILVPSVEDWNPLEQKHKETVARVKGRK